MDTDNTQPEDGSDLTEAQANLAEMYAAVKAMKKFRDSCARVPGILVFVFGVLVAIYQFPNQMTKAVIVAFLCFTGFVGVLVGQWQLTKLANFSSRFLGQEIHRSPNNLLVISGSILGALAAVGVILGVHYYFGTDYGWSGLMGWMGLFGLWRVVEAERQWNKIQKMLPADLPKAIS